MPENHLSTYLKQNLPKPLLEDIIGNRCLPIIGAGFSKNAILQSNKSMPNWDELGKLFANEFEPVYVSNSPLEIISAYDYEFKRVKLIEKMTEFLHIKDSQPGSVHKAFCELPFDKVVTTNFDFLLEKGYSSVPTKYCHIIMNEEDLPVKVPDDAICLLKLHGDLNHSKRLVACEADYDSFVFDYPLISTYLSNLLITRTPLFIGYSLEDPDFRLIWAIVKERLGKLKRPAYSIGVTSSKTEIKRYERRDVTVINLPMESSYGATLEKLFKELKEYWPKEEIEISSTTKEDAKKEFLLPLSRPTRLCYFDIPSKLRSFYKEFVFPIAESHGFVTVTPEDMVTPRKNTAAIEMGLFSRADTIVIDVSSGNLKNSLYQLMYDQKIKGRILLISELKNNFVITAKIEQIKRPPDVIENNEEFLQSLETWFKKTSCLVMPKLEDEPEKLVKMKAYRSAFISAMTLLETSLRGFLMAKEKIPEIGRNWSLYQMYKRSINLLELSPEEAVEFSDWIKQRNRILHDNQDIDSKIAISYVNKIMELLKKMKINPP
jgi:hypothetical protein